MKPSPGMTIKVSCFFLQDAERDGIGEREEKQQGYHDGRRKTESQEDTLGCIFQVDLAWINRDSVGKAKKYLDHDSNFLCKEF